MFKKEIIFVLWVAFGGMAFALPYEPDNTKVNKRDASGTTVTPEDQSKGSTRDIELTRILRQEIVNDKSFSMNAQNIKIVTLSGVVTLRGPVDSQQEKQRIDAMAKKTAGVKKVDNLLEIKSKAY
jgi:osmotically-inducible protein OsmY